MRAAILFAIAILAAPAQAAVTFLAPQPGAQLIGVQAVEISTDAVNVDRVEFRVDGVLVGVARNSPYRITFDFGDVLAARTVAATLFADSYRRRESAEVVTAALTAGESVNVDLVEVPMRLRSARLPRPADLRLLENSVEQIIREIQPVRSPAHFAFVVDRSLSMTGGKLEASLAAVREATTLLRAGDSSSLILFNHRVALPVAPATALSAASAAEVRPSGGTSLRDAVAAAITGSALRTYIVVITDGGDRSSLLSEEAALRRISGTRGVVSAVILGSASPFLRRAAESTGGNLLPATRQTVRQQVRRVIDDINSRYTVVYQSRGQGDGWRSIQLESRRRGIEVLSARKGYFAQ